MAAGEAMAAMARRIPRSDIQRPNGEVAVADRLLVDLELVGAVELGEFWCYPDLCAPFWRLYLNLSDGAAIAIARQVLPLPALHPVLIPPWIHFAARPGIGVRHIYVQFTTPGLAGADVRRLFPRPLDLHPAAELAAPLRALGEALAAGPPGPAELLAAKGAAFAALARATAALPAAQRAWLLDRLAVVTPARTLAAAIAADPAADWSVAAIARRLGCSPDHANRLFRRDLGAAPRRFVADLRLAAAARALATTAQPVDAIAEAHGFANRFSFSRAFARRFGVGPAGYRRRG
jgi:AraC-like DNA-binding protein